jgi:hypothetical protein
MSYSYSREGEHNMNKYGNMFDCFQHPVTSIQGFRLSSPWPAPYENFGLGSGLEGSRMGKGIPFGPYAES